ncbi:MAG: hypothetical protein QW364_01460 [Thermoplasmatales archaeon]
MVVYSPHKAILFGEHAVVYGYPALSSTVDLFAKILLIPSRGSTQFTPFVQKTLDHLGLRNVYVKVETDVPSGSGMGTSSMIILGILLNSRDFQKEELAREAFNIEFEVQGLGSPIDTTTIVAGGYVLTNGRQGLPLWKIEKGEKRWAFSSLPAKKLDLVIVYTGSKGSTREQVAKVKKFYERGKFAKDIMERIGNITEEGTDAVLRNDLSKIGELMNENHSELKIFGISTDAIEKIVSIGREYGFGAKLTGAGGGGAVIILPDRKDKLIERLKEMNVTFFDTSTTSVGIFKRSE